MQKIVLRRITTECLKADNHDANEDCDINTLRYCADLMKVVNATERFDAVLDFSGYEPKWIHDAVDMLVGKDVGVYIYIRKEAVLEPFDEIMLNQDLVNSSDSVYEVCEAKPASRRSLETDAVRPVDLKKRQAMTMTTAEMGLVKITASLDVWLFPEDRS